jgi:2,5-dihydroxypyridine 5,6-dioxygenase
MEFVRQPIEFIVEGGYVTEIKGGEHADEVRKFMDSYDDPRAYAISHIGWGTNEKCEWILKGIGMDGRAYDGIVLFSLGPNLEFGGDNNTQCHMDLPMKNCTAYLDGEMILEKGTLLPDDLKTPS